MSSGPDVASRSARSSSPSSAAAMPSKRRRASSVCNSSRIFVSFATEIEEVAGHLLQDQRLQALKIEQAEAQGLFYGGEKRARGIRPLELEQTAQGAHTPPVGAFFEGRSIALEARMTSAQELVLECRATLCPRRRRMMSSECGTRVTLAHDPRMAADLAAAKIDNNLGGILVDTHRPSNEALRHRVAIGVNRDVAIEIHDALEDFIDGRQHARQRLKIRLHLLVGNLPTPGERLAVQIVEVDKGASGQEVPFDPGERPFDSPFSSRMIDAMRAELEPQTPSEGDHLRRDHRLGPRARHHKHAGIVDDTPRAFARPIPPR